MANLGNHQQADAFLRCDKNGMPIGIAPGVFFESPPNVKGAAPTELSDLAMLTTVLRSHLDHAAIIAREINELGDAVGGGMAAGAEGTQASTSSPSRLSELNGLIEGMGNALASIHADVARLRRYVG